MTWLFFALGAVAINTTLGLGMRVISKDADSPRMTGLIYNIYAALASGLIWVLSGAPLPAEIPQSTLGLTILSALGYGIFQRGQFYLRKHVEASQLTPVMQTGLVVGFVTALVVLNEPLTPKKLLGALIILGATLLISLDKKLAINRYAIPAILIASALSLAGVIDKVTSPHYPLVFYTMIIWVLPLPLIALPLRTTELKRAMFKGSWKVPLLAALNSLSLLLFIKALQLSDVSRIIPVMSTVTVATVLGGIVLLHEHKDWRRKLLAGLLASLGVFILR